MTATMWDRDNSISSAEISVADADRLADIDRKHRLVAEFLETHGHEALLLRKPSNFAWFTSGTDSSRAGSSERAAALFVTAEARVLVAGSIDAAQIFDQHITGFGFQLKERPWHEPRQLLVDDLCRGRNVAGDVPGDGAHDASTHVAGMRVPLSLIECERIRKVGAIAAHAIEATCRSLQRGRSEAEIAGEVAHRIIKQGAIPERLQVLGDGKGGKYPHWSFGEHRVESHCTISAVARKWGICTAASRTIAFGRPKQELYDAHHCAMLVQATGMHFSQSDWELAEVWNRALRIYEKFGHPHEWQHAEQAEVIGYEPSEVPVVPRSEFRLEPRMAIHWHPSVGPAIVGDTILVGKEENELLTPFEGWPKLQIEVKGTTYYRPAILRRDD